MRITEQVGYNEHVVWEGRKAIGVSICEAIFNPMLPFAIIWAALDSMIFKSAFGSIDTDMGKFVLIFLLVHMMPVWMYLGGVLTSAFKAKNTQYAITDKAIYIQTGIFTTTVETKPFADMSHVSVRQGVFDKIFRTGDVISVCAHPSTTAYNSSRGHSHGMNIENIPDYEEVFRMVKQMQTDIYADTMYPNDLRPSSNHGYQTQYQRPDMDRQDYYN